MFLKELQLATLALIAFAIKMWDRTQYFILGYFLPSLRDSPGCLLTEF